jgi:hypothetical protein
LQALASDEKAHCDQFLGEFKKGCRERFREHLKWAHLVISSSGQTAILVENDEAGGSHGYELVLFAVKSNGKYVQVLSEIGYLDSIIVLKSQTRGYLDIQKRWRDGATRTEYRWNGRRYSAE